MDLPADPTTQNKGASSPVGEIPPKESTVGSWSDDAGILGVPHGPRYQPSSLIDHNIGLPTEPSTRNEIPSSSDAQNPTQKHIVGSWSDAGIPVVRDTGYYQSEFTERSSLGEGGFGSVYQCLKALDDQVYAIKKVPLRFGTKLLSQSEAQAKVKKLSREVTSMAQLGDCPNVVRYHTAWWEVYKGTMDADTDSSSGESSDSDPSLPAKNRTKGGDGDVASQCETFQWDSLVLYIQMQLCTSETVDTFLKARSRAETCDVDILQVLNSFLQLALGLQHVHDQGLIHRDLKPANCFVGKENIWKVGDFGFCRKSDYAVEDGTKANGKLSAGVGTASYMSPEQKNGSDYDAKTDIYSLGFMLFELCFHMRTGTERAFAFTGLRNQLAFPQAWCQTTKVAFPNLHRLIVSMLSHNPSDRPSAVEVVQKVRTILDECTSSMLDANPTDGAFLFRVETEVADDVLQRTMQLLRGVVSPVVVIFQQYALKSGP